MRRMKLNFPSCYVVGGGGGGVGGTLVDFRGKKTANLV